jgi:hypothetical protein
MKREGVDQFPKLQRVECLLYGGHYDRLMIRLPADAMECVLPIRGECYVVETVYTPRDAEATSLPRLFIHRGDRPLEIGLPGALEGAVPSDAPASH